MTGNQERIAIACQRAGAHYAAAQREREQEAASGGAEAVAQWAAPGCTPEQKAELAAYYEQLQQQEGGTSAA